MSLNDLVEVFDELDSQQRGYVTAEQICQFYSCLVESPTNKDAVHTVVERICGRGVYKVKKDVFLDVLEELERRHAVSIEAYWDFQALDSNGDNHISLSHALLLFREYHGDLFSLEFWYRFLASREKPANDVYFDELCSWLCETPADRRPSTQKEIVQEESRLERVQADTAYREMQEASLLMDNKDLERKEEEERQEHIEHSVKRKLHKWRTHGLAAMLEDHDGMGPDGDMRDDDLAPRGKESIKTSDVLTLLEAKYSTLQDRVLMEVATKVASMDSEKLEIFNKLKKMASKAQRHRVQDEELTQVLAKTVLPVTLLGLLGDLAEAEAGRRQEFETLRSQMQEEGKSEVDIEKHLKSAYNQIIQGSQTCDVILDQLDMRLRSEREALLSALHSKQSQQDGLSSTQVLHLHFCRLLRQLRLLQEEDHMTSAALAVGLAERAQVYKPQRYDWDRDRSDHLAGRRLEVRVGRQQVKKSPASLDLDALEKAGSVELRTRLVEELEQVHYLEREAMVQFLQGNEAKSYQEAAASLSPEARQKKIRTLRSRRQECAALNNWTANQKLLAEATALYREERQMEVEQASPNVNDTTVSAVVLSDLQQRQESEAGRILHDSLKKTERELTRAVLAQIEARKDELFPNIAFVTLGGLEVDAEDQEFLLTLEAKFKAMRDQVFVFGLIEKMGSGWKSLSKEEKQKEISHQRKEEKKLRGEGKLEDMEQLIGPRSQALPTLFQLIGEDKCFPKVVEQQHTPEPSKSVNLLADLTTRFDLEQEGLLSWLQLPDVKALPSRAKYVQLTRLAAERFVAGAEPGHETALLGVGLLERVGESRSKEDKAKQLTLAEKRSTLRKKAVLNGEKLRSPPEEKITPKEDNLRDLQAVLVRAVLRRHYQEREVMLAVLQEPGLDELVEAASVMAPEQAVRRLKELKAKRDALNLDNKADKEEQGYIFEEAGAIRAAGKMSALSRELGRTVLLAEAGPHLLAELQDLQDAELARLYLQLQDMSTTELSSQTDAEVRSRSNSYCHLVMKVFAKFDAESSQDFDKLVEQKYRSLLNLLVEENLCQQHGGRQAWDKLGQKQKVKAKSALSIKAAELWDSDNEASISSWMDQKFSIYPSLPYLAGTDRKQYKDALIVIAPSETITEGDAVKAEDIAGRESVTDLYRRYKREAGFVRDYLDGLLDEVPSDDDKQLLQNKLTWEITVLTSAQDFSSAALIVGLAERQTVDRTGRLQHDPARYQMLGEHLSGSKLDQAPPQSLKADEIADIKQLQALFLRTLHHKHLEEWKVMMALLISQRLRSLQEMVSVETELQRDNRITQLHRQRDELDLKEKSKQHSILEEALTVKKESVRQILTLGLSKKDQSDADPEISDRDIYARLMSQLLQFQLVEAQVYLEAFVVEDNDDIKENQAAILTEISQGHVTNVASVAFTGQTAESLKTLASQGDNLDDAELTQAVDGKYDALKDQLLIQALINQMGEAEWNRLSDLERQRLLMELKLRERRLRREGKYDEAAALLGDLQSTDENIRKLLGDSRAEHERKLRERLERRKARLAQGLSEEECDDLEAEELAAEEEEEREKKKNILLYLDQCSDQEKADLLRRLGELDDEHERARLRHLELVRQRHEERRMRQEGTLDTAAMLMGISQDQHNKSNLSKEEEKRRQQELARQRLEMVRQRRQLQGENLVRGETILLSGGEEGDQTLLGEGRPEDAVLSLLDKRHAKERDVLIKLLDDHSDGPERDEARVMTDEELRDKLEEQQELFNLWRESETKAPGDGGKILADSIPLSVEWKRRELEKDGELASDEDVKVALLARLQEVQEAEAGQAMLQLIDVDEDRAGEIFHQQQKKLSSPDHDNLATALLEQSPTEGGQGGSDEDKSLEEEEKTVVQALEKKYDAMRDKLLMEALMREMGESEWSRLSDLERQKKLVELKMRERRLRREGRLDEVAQLLGDFADDTDKLSQLLGQSAEDQRQRLQDKLALRKRLREEKEAEGVAVDEETLDELVEEEDKKIQRMNILNNLDKQFEAEKAALLLGLKNQSDHRKREKKRQMELARLQREQRKMKREDKFDSAAMIFALGEQHMKAQQQSMTSERDRQRELARQRLEALKQKRAAKEKGESQVNTEVEAGMEEATPAEITDESAQVQSSLLSGLEKLQADERATLLNLMSKVDVAGNVKKLSSQSNNELEQNLSKLHADHREWEAKTTKLITAQSKLVKVPALKSKFQTEVEKRKAEQESLLEKALANKLELERRRLATLRPNLTSEQVKEELSVCALTFLQEKQRSLLTSTQEHIKEKPLEELKQSRHTQQLAHQSGVFPALSTTCFTACLTSDLADLMQGGEGTVTGDEVHDMEIMLADEYNKEREELVHRGKQESINVDAALKRLEDQYEQRKQALNSDLGRQRAELRERLANKRQAADDMAWGTAVMAGQIFGTGAANFDSSKQAKKTELSRQDTLLQQKLQERRAAKEAEKARKVAEAEAQRIAEIEKAEAADRIASPVVDRRFSSPGLSRERTALDVNVTEDEKQAKYDQLLQQQSFKHNQMMAQQARQEMMLKKRLENRSNRRENEVAALFSLGERQKTNLQEIKKGEQERQLAQVRERKTRLRESRSQSPGKRHSEPNLPQ